MPQRLTSNISSAEAPSSAHGKQRASKQPNFEQEKQIKSKLCLFGSNTPLEKRSIDICQNTNSWFLYAVLYKFSVEGTLDATMVNDLSEAAGVLQTTFQAPLCVCGEGGGLHPVVNRGHLCSRM